MNTILSALRQVDLCLVIDTTGSMGPFLAEAKRHLVETVSALAKESDVRLAVGLAQYRDHPPQENSFVTKVDDLSTDLKVVQKAINGLQAVGGGDTPEAVFDGVRDACEKVQWRPHSLRFALLVGDAPPHGAKAHLDPEGRDRCPCGLTVHSVAAAAETSGVTVHALAMSNDTATVEAFAAIAQGTGGTCVVASEANAVIGRMREVLSRELGHLPLDERVLESIQNSDTRDAESLAESLGVTRGQAAASLTRLGKRGFLDF